MRITGIELSSDNANVFSFGLSKVSQTDKYLMKASVGLDADEIIRKFYGFGKASKPKFFNFSLPSREIVFRVGLNPNYKINESVSEIRDEFYRSISASRTGLINVLFTASGGIVARLSGYITKFEVPLHQEEPELQVTIQCEDPMLRGFSPVELDSSQIGASNPIFIFDSMSTAPHGLTLEVEFTDAVPQFTIQEKETNPEWEFEVIPDGGFLTGDILHLSSEYDAKQLYLDRSGSITQLMDRISPGSIWPIVFPKANEFHFPELADFDWVSLRYYPAYWGV